jgi:hypothetical protein
MLHEDISRVKQLKETFMKKLSYLLFILLILLVIPALACGGGSVNLPDVAVDELAGQASDAATQAAEAAAKAVIVAQEAADTAATLAASDQAQNLEATAVAAATNIANSDYQLPDTSSLRQKFAQAQPDENGSISITITDDEVNEAIQFKQNAAAEAGQEQPLENTAVTFTGGSIILTGNITSPITAQLTVVFRPYVADGILQFEVVSATLGSITVPAALLSASEATLNNTLNEAMGSLPANYTLQEVLMNEGTMTINGRKN